MHKVIFRIMEFIFYTALFITGTGVGLCINVFMVRGVPGCMGEQRSAFCSASSPVIHGGGKLLVLLSIPASIAVGYRLGKTRSQRKPIKYFKNMGGKIQ